MDYVPNTEKDTKEMLSVIGVKSFDDLYRDVPAGIYLKSAPNIGAGISENQLRNEIEALAKTNASFSSHLNFIGAGAYFHFVPAAVAHLVFRSEFYTAYTPYQPELSQGSLQAIFEFQTYIARLTGMNLANASMYCGASALAEAMLMAKNHTERRKIIVSRAINPEYREVVHTYANANELELVELGFDKNLEIDFSQLEHLVDDKTACVLIQYPNFFGSIEDLEHAAKIAHAKGALLVASVQEMYSLALLKSPGELGADIAACEAQSFGNSVGFGGPHVGAIACKTDVMRRIPGRLVGETTDLDGKKGYVLTLQAREQHIRREKATSNICSNEALCALAATIHLSAMGKHGLEKAAEICNKNAEYAKRKFREKNLHVLNDNTFNEFCVQIPNAERVYAKLIEHKILPGLKIAKYYPEMKDTLLLAFTEMVTKKDLDYFFEKLGASL